ncbi:hypothetical protein VB319_05525 [Vibrio parahaemolyticus]|nr:hypothetical protein [Vibrio parahaemolyticus]MEA5353450.1 hypothetical protein [Vibrio parahaemolyticus]SUQ32984.1 Uncharacterised protein [Vibrio furnissii]
MKAEVTWIEDLKFVGKVDKNEKLSLAQAIVQLFHQWRSLLFSNLT